MTIRNCKFEGKNYRWPASELLKGVLVSFIPRVKIKKSPSVAGRAFLTIVAQPITRLSVRYLSTISALSSSECLLVSITSSAFSGSS